MNISTTLMFLLSIATLTVARDGCYIRNCSMHNVKPLGNQEEFPVFTTKYAVENPPDSANKQASVQWIWDVNGVGACVFINNSLINAAFKICYECYEQSKIRILYPNGTDFEDIATFNTDHGYISNYRSLSHCVEYTQNGC